jgi:hypothetical protein
VDLAGRESLPERIQLGEDCFTAVAEKLACTARDQAHWRDIPSPPVTTRQAQSRKLRVTTGKEVGPVDLSRQDIVKMLRRAGLADVAAAAQTSLPDPVDTKVLEQFCARYGLLGESLMDRMGGSP